jgi:hypothetical protein
MEELFQICDCDESSDDEGEYSSYEDELGTDGDDGPSTDRFGNSRRYRLRREPKSVVDFREDELSTDFRTFNWSALEFAAW